MPDLRHDPLTGDWVLVAPDRDRRPPTPVGVRRSTHDFCPFCPGGEEHLTQIIREIRVPRTHAGEGPWVRVVPNRVPALVVEGEFKRSALGVYDRVNGVGAHEIVIETPEHDLSPAGMSAEHLETVLQVWQERMDDLMRDIRLRYVQIFKNYGQLDGATVSHPHSQVLATPVIPPAVARELEAARAHYRRTERCLTCDLIEQEQREGERVVTVNEDFIAICPYASRSPFELAILPRQHGHDFRQADARQRRSLARILGDLLRRIARGLGEPPFALALHSCPNPRAEGWRLEEPPPLSLAAHWRVSLVPLAVLRGGLELGTGMAINPTAPETAAEFLRQVSVNGAV